MDVSLLSLLAILLPVAAHALPAPQSDPNGVQPGGVGYDPNASGTSNQNAPGSNQANNGGGASGSDGSGVNISTGAVIGIVVGAVVIIAAVVFTMILFYKAQKRQWTMKEQLRHTGHTVKTAFTPRTPKQMTFSPVERERAGSSGRSLISSLPTPSPPMKPEPVSSRTRDETLGHHPSRPVHDAEKAAYLPTTRELTSKHSHNRNLSSQSQIEKARKAGKPLPPSLQVPQSKFEMDSPKTPIWQKVFGR